MAIKTFCDFCEVEIEHDQGGVLRTLEPTLTMSSTLQGAVDMGGPTEKFQEVSRLICDPCISSIKPLKK